MTKLEEILAQIPGVTPPQANINAFTAKADAFRKSGEITFDDMVTILLTLDAHLRENYSEVLAEQRMIQEEEEAARRRQRRNYYVYGPGYGRDHR